MHPERQKEDGGPLMVCQHCGKVIDPAKGEIGIMREGTIFCSRDCMFDH